MRAITYRRPGAPDVLELVDLPEPQPGPGEVRVRMAFSGVNPTDWKSRSKTPPAGEFQIPNQDGSGTVDAVGEGVSAGLVGLRVWIWEAAWQRPFGTAAEYTVVPAEHVVPLDDDRPFELGAALGIPFLTAHRCLTLGESVPDRLAPGALTGHAVLVQGGAGAVGNAAIQLARRDRAHHGEQPGEGRARTRGRRHARLRLPAAGRRRRGPPHRAERGHRRRRGQPRRQRVGRRAGPRRARRGRH